MSRDELIYRLKRRAELVSMSARVRAGIGLPFNVSYVPETYIFCSSGLSQLPELPWALEELDVKGTKTFSSASDTQWHQATDTGRSWPLQYFLSILHPPGNPIGDVQLAWTRSRLQQMVSLGLITQHSGDEDARNRAAGMISGILHSWVSANPWLMGIHFQSTMECALRVVSSCHAFDLARKYLQHDKPAWQDLLYLVHSHAYLIERRLCLYSSSGNHTIGECAGLIYAGALFEELPGSQRWLSIGLQNLEREAGEQIDADGGNREQSFRYLAMITDLCGLVTTLLKHQARTVPSGIEQAWKRGCGFLQAFADSPDDLPAVGDSDDGYALSSFLRLSWQNSNQTSIAHAGYLQLFPVSGYSRIDGGNKHGTMCFRHGALGTAAGFGHGHADALSVWWNIDGRRLLADPGTYLYEGDPRYRRYFRGTSAHNTVVVDCLDQAKQECMETFNWSHPYRASQTWHSIDHGGKTIVLAYHDGYGDSGVIHWRALIYDPVGLWIVWDRLEGNGRHQLDLHWHIDAKLEVDGSAYIISNGRSPWCIRTEGGGSTLVTGNDELPLGWISRIYGRKEPLNTLRVRAHTQMPHEFQTLIYPRHSRPAKSSIDNELLDELRKRCFLPLRTKDPEISIATSRQ